MGERVETVCVFSPILFLIAARVVVLIFLLVLFHHGPRGLPRPLVAEHQVDQVLLLPARVGGDVAQQQVLPQVFDPQLHEARPLEGRAAQQVAGRAAAQVFLQHRAKGTEALLTVTADVLQGDMNKMHIRSVILFIVHEAAFLQTKLFVLFKSDRQMEQLNCLYSCELML